MPDHNNLIKKRQTRLIKLRGKGEYISVQIPPLIKKSQQNLIIDTAEAYNLWDVLNSKYIQADRLLFWQNYIHDRDFMLLLKSAEGELNKSIADLEKHLDRFGIKGPKRHRRVVKIATNDEAIYDKMIAEDYHFFLQEMIELMLRAIRSSTTNDNLRNIFIKQLKNMIDFIDTFVKYIKIKGWLQTPPLYKQVPQDTSEMLDAEEAYHLWDHTTTRYDNLHQTDIYFNFAKDVSFKALMSAGMQVSLKKQIQMLEKEMERFGIPLPNRPAAVNVAPKEPSILSDEHIFRIILNGVQGLASLHGQAYKQSCTNARIREIFKKLLFSEIEYLDMVIKFGKLKGWLYPVPLYRLKGQGR